MSSATEHNLAGIERLEHPLTAQAMESPHAVPLSSLADQFGVDASTGLSSAQVEERRKQAGWNELVSAVPPPTWKKLLAQFQNVVIWILLAAAVISGITADWTDAAAIIAIVLLNALLGYFQEERAEQALLGLKKLVVPTAKVMRDGGLLSLPARELLPGDVIQLEAGDHIPADARLLHSATLKIEEGVLTGESAPVEKDAQLTLPAETSLADRSNMIYMGCMVVAGGARAIVVATGMQTEVGRIAGLLESYERKPTPLQRELEAAGRTLATACLGLVVVVFLLSLWRGDKLMDGLMSAISLAVAAVPEGLPAVVTVTLALGLQRMVRRNALIRKLPSVETLGCVTVICSDKTGTLTRNEMTVREVLADDRRYHVTGAGYDPVGEFIVAGAPLDAAPTSCRRDSLPGPLMTTLQIGAICNNARLIPADDSWQVVGDPMEAALIVAARKAGIVPDGNDHSIINELPFDSERKMMSVLVRESEGEVRQFTKGAPEAVLSRCRSEVKDGGVAPVDEARRVELTRQSEEMAGRALRVLACAFREITPGDGILESDLVFAGMVGIIDPPRDEVREAIARCRAAGIRTVMITGDHPLTALAIGRDLNLLSDQGIAQTGAQLEQMSDKELARQVPDIAVYARVAPSHKLRVVRALQEQDEVVAMTGDGVNDAPAVKAADIGIAMGRSGTDVTREAAAMVLMDDNFTSIVSAVEEGRAIYDNIRKFLGYLLSCNIGEMLLMLAAGILGWPAPLLPIQLLWINLVTDGLPALALAMEPAEPDLMRRRPRMSVERMLSWELGAAMIGQGALLAVIGLIAFRCGMGSSGDVDRARMLTFNTVVFSELFRALAARSSRWTFWQLGAITNPYLFGAVAISVLLQISLISSPLAHSVFEVTGQAWNEWPLIALLALTPVTLFESYKLIKQWRRSSPAGRAGDSGS